MEWANDLDIAERLLDEERYEDCITHLQDMQVRPADPYAYLYSFVLLARALRHWGQAEQIRAQAEQIWAEWHEEQQGRDPEIDGMLTEMRDRLDDLAVEMREQRPDGWADLQVFWTDTDREDAEAERRAAAAAAAEEVEGEEEGGDEEGDGLGEGEEENLTEELEKALLAALLEDAERDGEVQGLGVDDDEVMGR